MGMLQDTLPCHDLFQMFSEPSDVGFNGVARYRTWVICAHRSKTTALWDPFEVLAAVAAKCGAEHPTSIQDYLVATTPEIQLEAEDLAQRRGIRYEVDRKDLTYLLTFRENKTRMEWDRLYLERTGRPASENPQLVYFLGDDSSYGESWSAHSDKIPTYRVNCRSCLFWLPCWRRFLTQKEKLISMGWPSTREVSEAMGIPMIGCTDVKRAADLVGNAMHWQSSGVLQLICLACFGPSSSDKDGFPRATFL